jgi:DNA-binding response OmpR family regulator
MDPEKKPLFLVSDDPVLQEEARFGFPQVFDVVIASDSREAWALMKDRTPDMAMIEIRTGSAGGFGLARDMSQHLKLRHVPILMLVEREQDRWLAQTAGARVVLVQPVDSASLVEHALALLSVGPTATKS